MDKLISFLLSFSQTYRQLVIMNEYNIIARINEHKISICKLEMSRQDCTTDQDIFDCDMEIKRHKHHIKELEIQLKKEKYNVF